MEGRQERPDAEKKRFIARLCCKHKVEKVGRSMWLVDGEHLLLLHYSKKHYPRPFWFGIWPDNIKKMREKGKSGHIVFICGHAAQFVCVPVEVIHENLKSMRPSDKGIWEPRIRIEVLLEMRSSVKVDAYLNKLPAGLEDAEP